MHNLITWNQIEAISWKFIFDLWTWHMDYNTYVFYNNNNNNNTFFIGQLYREYTNDMSTIHLTLLPNGE